MAEPDIHIRVDNVTMAYGDFLIQQNLSFGIDRGQIFIIMGGSGCGKSTLLKIMIGLKSPKVGEILLRRRSVLGTAALKRTRKPRSANSAPCSSQGRCGRP